MNFLFGASVDIGIELADIETRKQIVIKSDGDKSTKYFLFLPGDTCAGKVRLNLKGKKLNHQGVKVELLGKFEVHFDRGNDDVFFSREQTLLPAGALENSMALDFSFTDLQFPHESYNGINVRLRYFLLVTIGQSVLDTTKEKELWVHCMQKIPDQNPPIRMEVGVENALHIEFEFSKSKFHLHDVVVGKIYFLLIRLKIKSMEISIIKVETSGVQPNIYEDKNTVTKYEIMDGCPTRGETIPIRLFLSGVDIEPTMHQILDKMSVQWYLNIVLTDEDDRRYFKKHEMLLYRVDQQPKKEVNY
jgi:vacuolar protein sorting-associated protein 26